MQNNKMHSSNSTSSTYNPPFPENDINSSSLSSKILQDPSCNNFLFNFPSSPHIHLEYEDAYLEFLELIYQHKSMENHTDETIDNTAPNHETAAAANHGQPITAAAVDEYPPTSTTMTAAAVAAVRKRCCKKDRHSKINTARGPRDRRMRLSLDVARKFFDLQDLLGYEKASRTVDWLLKNSKPAIRELERSNGGGGSSSFNMGATANSGSISTCSDGCEVVSSSNHSTTTAAAPSAVPDPATTKPKRSKKIKVARATVARESRRQARERARERTSQKKRLLNNEITTQPKIFSKSSLTESAEFDDLNSGETRVDPLVYSATWNPSAILDNYQDNAGLISTTHQIADEFEYCGKPWEAYDTSFN